jgi:hypothetical protein
MSDVFAMKRWSSGFRSRIAISVLHWDVTSGSSFEGRWLTTAKPTPNFGLIGRQDASRYWPSLSGT